VIEGSARVWSSARILASLRGLAAQLCRSGWVGLFLRLGLSAPCRCECRGRATRQHRLRPENVWFAFQGRGFNSRHLHHVPAGAHIV